MTSCPDLTVSRVHSQLLQQYPTEVMAASARVNCVCSAVLQVPEARAHCEGVPQRWNGP